MTTYGLGYVEGAMGDYPVGRYLRLADERLVKVIRHRKSTKQLVCSAGPKQPSNIIIDVVSRKGGK